MMHRSSIKGKNTKTGTITKIEKGKIVGRVKNTMISGNSFKALGNVDYISNEKENVYGSMSLPYLQTKNVEISS